MLKKKILNHDSFLLKVPGLSPVGMSGNTTAFYSLPLPFINATNETYP